MKPVQERPLLPQTSPGTFDGLLRFTGDVVIQLINIFQEYGFRINRVLPKDGSEPASSIMLEQLSADPPEPVAGRSVIWQSDGTGSGDDGDIMITIVDSGGTAKTTTLVDYSAI